LSRIGSWEAPRTRRDSIGRRGCSAALNHPAIASIYGVEQADGVRGLVLELVEGPTLAERLSRGRLPIAEALAIARHLIDALEAAHAKGIVHRDLKPGNIKVTSSGAVKVLDFGLAKSIGAALSSSDAATVGATLEGTFLGTAAYVSPEQARGEPIDKRTDIWAFGCVLYEMLTGALAFRGRSVPDTLAAVLAAKPDWSALPPETPDTIARLLRRCLQPDVARRLHEIADARLDLEDGRCDLLAGPAAGAAHQDRA
jgi:serine/threonine protein kinase